jgi:ATP-dependent Clp protease ATP-binding subunit ClpA
MFERFSERARRAMARANQQAQRFNHEYIGTEHILLGIVAEGDNAACEILRRLGVTLASVERAVERLVKAGPEMVTMGRLPQIPRAKRVIEYAIQEARRFKHDWVGTEHILLGLLREEDGVAAQVLASMNVTHDSARQALIDLFIARESTEHSQPHDERIPIAPPLQPTVPYNLRGWPIEFSTQLTALLSKLREVESGHTDRFAVYTARFLFELLQSRDSYTVRNLALRGFDAESLYDALREFLTGAQPED